MSVTINLFRGGGSCSLFHQQEGFAAYKRYIYSLVKDPSIYCVRFNLLFEWKGVQQCASACVRSVEWVHVNNVLLPECSHCTERKIYFRGSTSFLVCGPELMPRQKLIFTSPYIKLQLWLSITQKQSSKRNSHVLNCRPLVVLVWFSRSKGEHQMRWASADMVLPV